MRSPRIKVTSPSFSRNAELRAALAAHFRHAVFNETGGPIAGEALVHFLADADAAVVGLERIDEALLARTPRLRLVAKYGVGLDNVDEAACARRGVAIGWTPGVNALSVAELALTLMLGLLNQAFRRAFELRDGTWTKRGGVLLSGRTVGIVGLGHVGRELVQLLRPFRCRVLANDVIDRRAWCAAEGVTLVDKEGIWSAADVITLHLPLTPETEGLIDARVLDRCRPGAVLVNTSRGTVVDEVALKQALIAGRIAGAALDVFAEEPPTDQELLRLPNLIATPHIGGASQEAVLAMGRAAIGHLERFFATREERISA